jgi:hypothetical protein
MQSNAFMPADGFTAADAGLAIATSIDPAAPRHRSVLAMDLAATIARAGAQTA